MRGEFIRGDGLVLPNNVTKSGAGRILDMAFRKTSDFDFVIGLCNAVYTPDMDTNNIEVPAGVRYYEELPRTAANWPTLSQANGEFFIESRACVIPAAQWNIAVTRLFLGQPNIGYVFALSSPLPTPLQITPTTPAADRTFRYRLYLR